MKLRCEECGSTTEFARGWRAKIVDDDEEPEMGAYTVYYCPTCAQREFGPSKPSHREEDRFPKSSAVVRLARAEDSIAPPWLTARFL